MPEVNPQLPGTPNVEWQDLQFRFDGKWIPDVDPSLIGPNNYATLQNLRYKDSGLEGVNGYTKVNNTTLVDHATLGDFPLIRNGIQLRSDRSQRTYVLVHSKDDAAEQGRVFVNRTTIGTQGDFDTTHKFDISGNPYYADSAINLTGQFSKGPRGNVLYSNGNETMIFGGDEQSASAVFSVDNIGSSADWVPANPIDYTEAVTNNLTADKVTISTAGKPCLMIMTTRPIQSMKLYISSGNAQTDTTLTCQYWTGSAWSADVLNTDGTASGGATLAQTGTITLDAHTKGLVRLKHYEDLYLYAYILKLTESSGTDATADIYSITVDHAFQNIENVWDGVYRQPIQWQFKKTSSDAYSDYTLQVNAASDEDAPVGGKVTGMESSGEIIVMFTEQMAGIRMQMLGALVNLAGGTMTVKYWTGSAWAAVGVQIDGTSNFNQTGLISWIPNTAEKPRTLFNTFGYAYQITTSGTLTTATEIYVDICTGVPAIKTMGGYDFTALFGTRVMLGGYAQGNEGNRMDFSVANAPDVYNGEDSSDYGRNSLYFGGEEKITAATQLFNRFGSNIYSMLLVCKANEVFILVGDTPDEFTIYPVSQTLGCPAPLTLARAEVNFGGLEENQTRNVAIWLSHSGPVMFDGAIISPLRGIDKYFDPNDDAYIEWDNIINARAFVDPLYKEYNIMLPTTVGQSTINKWLVYDMERRKWYEKTTGSVALQPQCAFEVVDTSGERLIYGGIDSGHMMRLEDGDSWDSTGITQKVKTGDFFPSNNIWDATRIRKFKLLIKKIPDTSATNTLYIRYYNNTDTSTGAGVNFIDAADLTGAFISFVDTTSVEWTSPVSATLDLNTDIGTQRVLRLIQDLNRLGWAHAWEFELTTTSVAKGFQPIAWGIQYRVERKDNTSTDE